MVVIKLMIGLAPLGPIMLKLTTAFVGWLASLDPSALVAIVGAIAGVVGAIALASGSFIVAGAAIVGAIALIMGAVIYAYTHFGTFRNVVNAVWQGIVTAALWAWQNVLKPIFEGIAYVITQVVIPAAIWLWQNVLVPAFAGITAAIGIAWSIISPILNGIGFVITNVLVPIVLFLWRNVIQPAWQGIQLAISIAWAIIQVIFGLIQIQVKILADVFAWLWHNAIEPVWHGIAAAIGFVWDNLIKPVFNALGGFIRDHVVPAFQSSVDTISKIWSSISDAAKTPIRFIINTVLNDGLLAGYNKLASIFHVKPDDVRIPLPAGFATGGPVHGAGTATSDSIPALLSHGEHVWTAREVAAAGGHAAVSAIRSGVLGGFAAGGPVYRRGVPAYAGGGAVGDIGNAILHPLDFLRGLVNGPVAKLRDMVGGSEFGRVLLALPGRVLDSAGDAIARMFSFGGGSGGGRAASGQLAEWIASAVAFTGVGPSWISGLTTLIMRESGGNPKAINRTDSNALAGHPSQGLMQTIPGTFSAYRDARLPNDITDPIANIVAGINYIRARYGGIGNVQQANPSLPPMGYDSGGYLMPGLTLAYNGTGTPEPIRTAGQEAALQRNLSRAPRATLNIESFYGGTAAPEDIAAELDWLSRAGG